MNQSSKNLPIGDNLDQVLGYLNFSSGTEDIQFLKNLNSIYAHLEQKHGDQDGALMEPLFGLLNRRADEVSIKNGAFRNIVQAKSVIRLALVELPKRYFEYHSDLLFHQSPENIFNSLLIGRFFEALLSQGGPWDESNRIIDGAIRMLNDFVGHRPLAVLENRRCEPYEQEFIRPIPVYIRGVGAARGQYFEIVSKAIALLEMADPVICRQAQFEIEKLHELAIDPRAFDFDHPANRRPNHQFGQWDELMIDQDGYFRRFVVNRLTIDALLWRVKENKEHPHDELLFEAAAVFAGTILMACGICGRGPLAFDSEFSLAGLMPVVAGYRDHFYDDLLSRLDEPHQKRLLLELRSRGQAFAAARQDINAKLSNTRAQQLVHARLASIYARMGYLDAANEQASVVPATSARLVCQIDCLLATAQQQVAKGHFVEVVESIPQILHLIQRGIACGAIVDPWNILGFDGNYDLFSGTDNSIRDHRIDELIEMVELAISISSQVWSEAAAANDLEVCQKIQKYYREIVDWWHQFAPHRVPSVEATDPVEVFEASQLVAQALTLWKQGGAAAGDIEFWANHSEMFDSGKAYSLVIDALMEREDTKTPMALMIRWLSNAERLGLTDGETSIHDFVDRWIVEQTRRLAHIDRGWQQKNEIWKQIRKFYDYVEANADEYWEVPVFELIEVPNDLDIEALSDDDPEDDESDEKNGIYRAAYDEMVYEDSTNDGIEGEIYDTENFTEEQLEEEVNRVTDRLEFLATIANFWKQVSGIPLKDIQRTEDDESDEKTLANHQSMIASWVSRARHNLNKLSELLDSVNQYPLPVPTGDHESLVNYDRFRLFKESLLSRIIVASVETEDSIRSMMAVISAIDYLQKQVSLDENSAETQEQRNLVAVFAAMVLREPVLIRQYFSELIGDLQDLPLLYVPLSKAGKPEEIVSSRLRQSAINELLLRLPWLGLVSEVYELTNTVLVMERNHPLGPGAVTEFDELFRTGYTSTVRALIYCANHYRGPEGNSDEIDESELESRENILFQCLEMWTESMLVLWLEHSKTLRLSVMEKVADNSNWEKLKDFIESYGAELFTQQFLHLGNIRAILHQGVEQWFYQLEKHNVDSIELVRQLDKDISRQNAVKWLTLILESVIENYNEYRDYNGTTTQSDRGELFHILLDFLRLRSRYDRVCWHLKPVVWAHEQLVRGRENGVAKLWRRSLTDRVGPEADKYLDRLKKLQEKYSVQMSTVAERLSERFIHPMQIDRMRALVEPSIADPFSKESQDAFDLLKDDAKMLCERPLGIGLDLPAWLSSLESEVKLCQLPKHVREAESEFPLAPLVESITDLKEALDKLPKRGTD